MFRGVEEDRVDEWFSKASVIKRRTSSDVTVALALAGGVEDGVGSVREVLLAEEESKRVASSSWRMR